MKRILLSTAIVLFLATAIGWATVVTKTADYSLDGSENGYVIVVNSASNLTMKLPALSTPDIGFAVTFIKAGAGNLTIQAPAGVTIADGAAAGTLVNSTAAETYASVELVYVVAGKWKILTAHGTWATSASTWKFGIPGPISAVNGGTGQSSYTVGDILHATSTTELSKLGIGASGTYLKGGAAPSWGSIADGDLPATIKGLTLAPAATGFTIAGGTTSKTFTMDTDVTASALAPIASPAFTGTVTLPTGLSGFVKATAGVVSAAAIADGDLPSALTGKTYNALTPTAAAIGFTLAGGTTSKTLTLDEDFTASSNTTALAAKAPGVVVGEDADSDTDDVLTTTWTGGYGILIVRESTGTEAEFYWCVNATLTAQTAEATFTTTKDNASTYNTYFEGGVLKVQNKVGDNKNIKVVFVGIGL